MSVRMTVTCDRCKKTEREGKTHQEARAQQNVHVHVDRAPGHQSVGGGVNSRTSFSPILTFTSTPRRSPGEESRSLSC